MLKSADNFHAFVVVQAGLIYQEESTCADGNLLMLCSLHKKKAKNSIVGCVAPPCLPVWCAEPTPSCWSLRARASRKPVALWAWAEGWYGSGFLDSSQNESTASMTSLGGAKSPLFPPEFALHLVKLACVRCPIVLDGLFAYGTVKNLPESSYRLASSSQSQLKP